MELGCHLSNLSLSLCGEQQKKLLQHIDLLHEWNRHINITAVSKEEMITKHIVDSLSIGSFLSTYEHVADIGTGGGFPGLPLAIMYPHNNYVLMDSNHKKCGFLRHVINQLNLNNVNVIHSRVEKYQEITNFDAIVCRALSVPQKVYNLSNHLLKKGGKIFVMAGQNYQQNWQEISSEQKEKWTVHPLYSISNVGKRYLLEYSDVT